jgi:hypothetical protein
MFTEFLYSLSSDTGSANAARLFLQLSFKHVRDFQLNYYCAGFMVVGRSTPHHLTIALDSIWHWGRLLPTAGRIGEKGVVAYFKVFPRGFP